MRRFSGHRHLPFLLLLLLAGSLGPNDLQAQDQKSPHADRYGDPLPHGAIARLGTLRLVDLSHPVGVAVSPNGKIVASGAREGKQVYLKKDKLDEVDTEDSETAVPVTRSTIRLWDVTTGKLIRQIETPDAPVSALIFDPSGERLYAGCGMFLCCWEVATGKKLWHQVGIKPGEFARFAKPEQIHLAKDSLITINRGEVECIAPHPKGAIGSWRLQYAVRIWHRKSGQPRTLPKALESTVNAENDAVIHTLFHAVAIAPDKRHVAVIRSRLQFVILNGKELHWKYTDRRLEIIELESGKVRHALPDPTGGVAKVVFSNDGKRVAVAGRKDIWIVDIARGKKENLAKNLPEPVSALLPMDGSRLAAQVGDDDLVWG